MSDTKSYSNEHIYAGQSHIRDRSSAKVQVRRIVCILSSLYVLCCRGDGGRFDLPDGCMTTRLDRARILYVFPSQMPCRPSTLYGNARIASY